MQAIKRICIIARREIKFNRKNPRHVEEARKFSYFALGRANACKVIAFGVTKALLYTIILRNYFAVMRGNLKKYENYFSHEKIRGRSRGSFLCRILRLSRRLASRWVNLETDCLVLLYCANFDELCAILKIY